MGDDGGTRKIRPCSAEVECSLWLDPLTCPAKQNLSRAVTVIKSDSRVEVKSKSYLLVLCPMFDHFTQIPSPFSSKLTHGRKDRSLNLKACWYVTHALFDVSVILQESKSRAQPVSR